jgi:DNA-binding NarL/FixJ family response regulator
MALGKPGEALDHSKRRLQQLPPDDIVERIYPLELLVCAGIACGDLPAAAAAEAELERTAQIIDTPATQAAALWAAGQIEAANGRNSEAIRLLEEAADLYQRSDVSYEAARVRMDLADSLARQGLFDRSSEQAMLALDAFRRLGAGGDAARAEARLGKALPPAPASAPRAPNLDGLTPREEEILRLLATGQSNAEIAVQFVLSTRTVERHVTNIYQKIGAAGRTARASATAYAFRRGLLAPTE